MNDSSDTTFILSGTTSFSRFYDGGITEQGTFSFLLLFIGDNYDLLSSIRRKWKLIKSGMHSTAFMIDGSHAWRGVYVIVLQWRIRKRGKKFWDLKRSGWHDSRLVLVILWISSFVFGDTASDGYIPQHLFSSIPGILFCHVKFFVLHIGKQVALFGHSICNEYENYISF